MISGIQPLRILGALALAATAPIWGLGWAYCGSWDEDMAFNVCLAEVANDCGGSWSEEFDDTMWSWNTALNDPNFTSYVTPEYSISPDNDRSETSWMDRSVVSSYWGPVSATALATAWWWWSGSCGEFYETDITIYADNTFTLTRENSASGGPYYFSEIMAHELGHAATLEHEDGYFTLMNSITHAGPSAYRYAHMDERRAIESHGSFAGGSFYDHALLPYDDVSLNSTSIEEAYLDSTSTVEPGDVVEVGGFRVENWGTYGADDIVFDLVLSDNETPSEYDEPLTQLTWGGVTGWGYLSSPLQIAIPEVPSGYYYVVGAVDMLNDVSEQYGFNNTWTFGALTVDADADNDGYDVMDDCDDSNASVHPGASEVCDGLDTDCSGSPSSDEIDADGDGYMICEGDCNDGSSGQHPGAAELCDGVDNDCSGSPGSDEVDADHDGTMVCAGDCNDANPDQHPGAAEICDGVDNDCSGSPESDEADSDHDGFMVCEDDCDDGDGDVFPGAYEDCDGLDNDCDGDTDEGCPEGDDDDSEGDDDDNEGDDDDNEGDDDDTEDDDDDNEGDDDTEPAQPGACSCSQGGARTTGGTMMALAMLILLAIRRRPSAPAAPRHLITAGLVGTLCLVSGTAMATTHVPIDERGLAALSENVVRGTIKDVEVVPWGPVGVPVTRFELQIDEAWKGEPGSTLHFYQPGGELEGRRAMVLAGSVRFEPGDDVLLFLERTVDDVLVVAGLSLGALRVAEDVLEPLPPVADGVRGGQGNGDDGSTRLPFVGWTLDEAYYQVLDARFDSRPAIVPALPTRAHRDAALGTVTADGPVPAAVQVDP